MGFPTKIIDIAKEWNNGLFTPYNWRSDPNRPRYSGEAGGYFVEAIEDPQLFGYLKPTKADGRHRAAYEKIASDLAAELNILVPPVLLYKHANAQRDEESNVCISLIIYPEIQRLKDFRGGQLFALQEVRELMSSSSGVMAFDTYLGNTDRSNECNILYGNDPDFSDEQSFHFIDHSNTMNHDDHWADNKHRNVFFPSFPQELVDNISLGHIKTTCLAIEKLEEDFIRYTVSRIPEEFLPISEKDIIIVGLLERRNMVRPILNASLAWKE